MQYITNTQAAIIYYLLYAMTNDIPEEGNFVEPLDRILRENRLEDYNNQWFNDDGMPMDCSEDIQEEWTKNVGNNLGEEFQDSYYGKVGDTYRRLARQDYWD